VRLDAEYELLLTNRLTLTPSADLDVAFSDDEKMGVGSGFSSAEVGLRLSYDILDRTLSPYIGVVWERKFGETADFAREEGEDVEAVIQRLAGDDLGELLVGEDGKPIMLTAGAKGGSPALLAIEASLEQLGSGLSAERTAGSKASIKALRNVILAMSQTGDQDALQTAADLAEGVFSAQLNERMAFATDNVLKAFETVSRDGTSNIQLSERLLTLLQTS